jgi:hypothetical protein
MASISDFTLLKFSRSTDRVFVGLHVLGQHLVIIREFPLHLCHPGGICLVDVAHVVSGQQEHIAPDCLGVRDAGDSIGRERVDVVANTIKAENCNCCQGCAQGQQNAGSYNKSLADGHV